MVLTAGAGITGHFPSVTRSEHELPAYWSDQQSAELLLADTSRFTVTWIE